MAGVSVDTVRNWDRQGRLSARRSPGGQRRFHLEDVESFLQRCERPRGAPAGDHTPRKLSDASVQLPTRVESEISAAGGRTIQSPSNAGRAAEVASQATQIERLRREAEANVDALRLDALKAHGRASAIQVPAEWRAYVVRDLETYVTAVQFPRGLSDWEARSFVEDRVKTLLQPYWDEIARREEHERRRLRLQNLLECGRRHFRVETFLWTTDETEEAELAVEGELARRVKWDWSEESVCDLVEEILQGFEDEDPSDESDRDDDDDDPDDDLDWDSDEEED